MQRAKIVLLAFKRLNNEEIGELVELNPQQVSGVAKAMAGRSQRLISVECTESLGELKKQIDSCLPGSASKR
ncbi:MAG: hypothetical protein R3C99_14750 [Pirellulaceae bacterium]